MSSRDDIQTEIDLVMDRMRQRCQEIAPLAMAQLERGGDEDWFRSWFVDLARGDEPLTDLCIELQVLSRIAASQG